MMAKPIQDEGHTLAEDPILEEGIREVADLAAVDLVVVVEDHLEVAEPVEAGKLVEDRALKVTIC